MPTASFSLATELGSASGDVGRLRAALSVWTADTRAADPGTYRDLSVSLGYRHRFATDRALRPFAGLGAGVHFLNLRARGPADDAGVDVGPGTRTLPSAQLELGLLYSLLADEQLSLAVSARGEMVHESPAQFYLGVGLAFAPRLVGRSAARGEPGLQPVRAEPVAVTASAPVAQPAPPTALAPAPSSQTVESTPGAERFASLMDDVTRLNRSGVPVELASGPGVLRISIAGPLFEGEEPYLTREAAAHVSRIGQAIVRKTSRNGRVRVMVTASPAVQSPVAGDPTSQGLHRHLGTAVVAALVRGGLAARRIDLVEAPVGSAALTIEVLP